MKKLLLGLVIFTMAQASFAQAAVYQEKSLLGLSQDLFLYSTYSAKGADVYLGNRKPVYLQVAPGEKSVHIHTILGNFSGYEDREAVSAHLVGNPGQSLPVNVVSQRKYNTTEVIETFERCSGDGHHEFPPMKRKVATTYTYVNTDYVLRFTMINGMIYQFNGSGKVVYDSKPVYGPCF